MRYFSNDVVETAETIGATNPYVLLGAVVGGRKFDADYDTGDKPMFVVRSDDLSEFEFNFGGTFTAPDTLPRGGVFLSSNNNNAVVWNSGHHPLTIYVPTPAEVLELVCTGGLGTVKSVFQRFGSWFQENGVTTSVHVWNIFDGANSIKIGEIDAVQHKVRMLGTPVGACIAYYGSTAPAGWILTNGTIGNAASGATNRANADTLDLYTLIWGSFANAEAAVSTGRGANAAADYAANKTIAVPSAMERVIAGRTTAAATILSAAGSGLDSAVMGKTGGHQQMASHNHSATGLGSVGNNLFNGTGRAVGTADGVNSGNYQDVLVTVNSSGGGNAQNVQPTLILNYIVKL